jgi:flavin-dependent dehydrogenase
MSKMTRPIVVVGGGLAGTAAACLLLRAGRQTLLIERERQATDKICGEYVSAEAQEYCRGLGLNLAALGGHRILGVRLVRGKSVVASPLPSAGLGLSRRTLDEAMLNHAARCGAEVRRGQIVTLLRDREPITLGTSDGAELQTDTLFLATGKHDLRGLRRAANTPPDLVGFKVHMRLAPAQRAALIGWVEITLLQGGYAGLQLIEGDLANLCLLVDRSRLQAVGGGWDALREDLMRTEPHLRTRLDGSTAPAIRPLSISRVPYGFVNLPQTNDPPDIFRLGDQVGVVPSFTGAGMSIALHTAVIAAASYLAGGSAADYHRRIRRDIVGQIGRATQLYRLGSSATGKAVLMCLVATWPRALHLATRLTRIPRWAMSDALEALGELDHPSWQPAE